MTADTRGIRERLKDIKEREVKATKGPWHRGDVEGLTADCVYREDGANICKALLTGKKSENLDFIAQSRADIPWLVEQLEKAMGEAESIVEQCCKVAEDPKIWKKFADKDGKPASMSNLTVAGLAVARAIRSRWQRGEGKR